MKFDYMTLGIGAAIGIVGGMALGVIKFSGNARAYGAITPAGMPVSNPQHKYAYATTTQELFSMEDASGTQGVDVDRTGYTRNFEEDMPVDIRDFQNDKVFNIIHDFDMTPIADGYNPADPTISLRHDSINDY